MDGKFYVWLASNFRSQRYDYYKLKNESNVVYYINEWNGEEWLKWRLGEHEEIVVLKNKQQMTSKKFVLIKDELVQIKDEYAPEPQTLYKDLGTYGENDDLDKIVLKDLRDTIVLNIYFKDFDIPNVYSIGKKIDNSQSVNLLSEIYVERVNYFAYVKKVNNETDYPWEDCKITLVKSCPEGLKKSQEIDLGRSNWDSNNEYIGEIEWTELGSGGGGGSSEEEVTINFTDFDEELLYFASEATLSDFVFYNLTSVTVTVGNNSPVTVTDQSSDITIPSSTLVKFSINPNIVGLTSRAFIFTKS